MNSAVIQRPVSGKGIYFIPLLSATLLLLASNSIAVAQAGSTPMMNHAPVWSPLENWILFDSDRDGETHLYLIDPDQGTLRKVTGSQSASCCGKWTPDGRHILFRSERGETWEPFRIRPDGNDPQVITEREYAREPTSEDGIVLTLSVQDGGSMVVAVDSVGTRTHLTRDSWASQPSFSPDAQQIVYEERKGDHIRSSRIVVMDRDGSNRRVLELGTDPSWSPDGSLILFKTPSTQASSFHWEVATIRPDGSMFKRLARGVHPDWSPDGLRIAFMAEGSAGRTDIWIMDRDGAEKRCLTCEH